MMSVDKKWLYPVPGMHAYKGILCNPDSTIDVLKWMEEELEFDEGDVLLCAYPTSGDAWLQEVVWYLHHLDRLDAKNTKQSIGHRVPHIDHELRGKQPKDFFEETKSPRIFKSRMPANFLKRHLDGKVKVVYWVMDPRDTVLKYHHLYNTLGKLVKFPHIEFDDFFRLFQEKQLFQGDWFETTLSFLPHANKSGFLYLKYEEEAKDPRRTVLHLADFFNIVVSDDQVHKLVNVVPFDTVTDWKTRFSPDQLAWYKRKYKEKMVCSRLENSYL